MDQDATEETKPKTLAGKITNAAVVTILWIADLTLDHILRRRQNERTIQPTKRITFPPPLKRQLLNEQNRQCMYCGERKTTKTTDVDHKDPVVRGGENERYNYQILCKPCNQRKGMQTDGEFRQRYAELLPRFHHGQALMPPERPTPQKAFRQLTKETEMAETAREFKRTKYISPPARRSQEQSWEYPVSSAQR